MIWSTAPAIGGCDQAEALSVGIAAWSAPALRAVEIDQAVAALPAVTEHRDDLVRARTQLINRPYALLVTPVPFGLPAARPPNASGAPAADRILPADRNAGRGAGGAGTFDRGWYARAVVTSKAAGDVR